MEKGYPIDAEEMLRFQIKRSTVAMFKQFLVILEDLGMEHDEALRKLHEKLPEQYKAYVELADYLTEEKSENLRKKVLSVGNDTHRYLDEFLNQFEITFKNQR